MAVLPLALVCLLRTVSADAPRDEKPKNGAGGEKPPKPPLGLPAVQWPDDNPYSADKVELGRLLYFDKRLSSDSSVACTRATRPRKPLRTARRSPPASAVKKGAAARTTVINRAYSTSQFWDGRADSLEEQAKGPIANPIEMTAEKDADAGP